jgi:hypothetical protein
MENQTAFPFRAPTISSLDILIPVLYMTIPTVTSRLLKNAHLRRSPHPSSLRRTDLYASFLGISGALDLDVFQQPVRSDFFSDLLEIIFQHPCVDTLCLLSGYIPLLFPRKTAQRSIYKSTR